MPRFSEVPLPTPPPTSLPYSPPHPQPHPPPGLFQICFPTCWQAQDIPFTEDKNLDLLLEFWLGNTHCRSVEHSSPSYSGVSRFSLLWLTPRHSENLSTVCWLATSFPCATRWQYVREKLLLRWQHPKAILLSAKRASWDPGTSGPVWQRSNLLRKVLQESLTQNWRQYPWHEPSVPRICLLWFLGSGFFFNPKFQWVTGRQ